MRTAIFAAVLALLASANPTFAGALLANTAAALLEAAPFLLAGAAFSMLGKNWHRLLPYLGCGCTSGPSARSVPAFIATCLMFGPWVACARFCGAAIVASAQTYRSGSCTPANQNPLAHLAALLPSAAFGAAISLLLPLQTWTRTLAPAFSFTIGAIAGFIWSPCALGGIAIAVGLRHETPLIAAGFLFTSGIVDLRAWRSTKSPCSGHDALSYALAACACAIVGAHGCAGILHPHFALPLLLCAIVFAMAAARHRAARNVSLRLPALAMFAGTMFSSPPPQYHATETTLTDAFPGERVTFTGAITRTGNATALVRYAITCCRADAAPIVVRLTSGTAIRGWARADGSLAQTADGLELHVQRMQPVPEPADPFVYR